MALEEDRLEGYRRSVELASRSNSAIPVLRDDLSRLLDLVAKCSAAEYAAKHNYEGWQQEIARSSAAPDPLVSTLVEALREAKGSIERAQADSRIPSSYNATLILIDAAIAAAEGKGEEIKTLPTVKLAKTSANNETFGGPHRAKAAEE